MEQLIAKFCLLIQLNADACNKAMLGLYTDSNIQKEYDASKSYSEGRINYYVNENKTVVYSATALAAGYDMYQKKEVRISTPFNPICNSLNVDLRSDNNDTVHMDWKWDF